MNLMKRRRWPAAAQVETNMAVDAVSVRAEASDRREAARATAQQYFQGRAEARRDQRVEEAKAALAARATPAERAAEAPPPRRPTSAQIIDILA